MPDVGFPNVRRNLLISSGGLILFLLANGEIQNETAIFAGTIKIEHAFVLEWAIWIVHIYIIWRFWLLSKVELNDFWSHINNKIAKDLKFRDEFNSIANYHFKTNKKIQFAQYYSQIRRSAFSRSVICGVSDVVKFPYFKMLKYETKIAPSIIFRDARYSSTMLPFILGFLPFIILVSKKYLNYIGF